MLDLNGRVVMVSGANRGIGRAVAEVLADRGCRLSLGARDPSSIGALQDALTCPYDALDPASPERWTEATVDAFGRIDALVNNAGLLLPGRLDDPDEAFEEMFRVNAMGPLRLIRAAMPHLRRAGSGRVVTVVSLSGKRVANDNAGYAMSKFAALALHHAVRHAGWDDGVRATAICPSFVDTDMTAWVQGFPREEMIQPHDLGELVATAIALPDTAAVAELLVNCRLEPGL